VSLRHAVAEVTGISPSRVALRRLNTTIVYNTSALSSLNASSPATVQSSQIQALLDQLADIGGALNTSLVLSASSGVNLVDGDTNSVPALPGWTARRRRRQRLLQGSLTGTASLLGAANTTTTTNTSSLLSCQLLRRLVELEVTVYTDVEVLITLSGLFEPGEATDEGVGAVVGRVRNVTTGIQGSVLAALRALVNASTIVESCTGSAGGLSDSGGVPTVFGGGSTSDGGGGGGDVYVGGVPSVKPVATPSRTPSPSPSPSHPPVRIELSPTPSSSPVTKIGGVVGGAVGGTGAALCLLIPLLLVLCRKRKEKAADGVKCVCCGRLHAYTFEVWVALESAGRDPAALAAAAAATHALSPEVRGLGGFGHTGPHHARLWHANEIMHLVEPTILAERDERAANLAAAGTAAAATAGAGRPLHPLHDVLRSTCALPEADSRRAARAFPAFELPDDVLDEEGYCRECWLRRHACRSCSRLLPFTRDEAADIERVVDTPLPAGAVLNERQICAECAALGPVIDDDASFKLPETGVLFGLPARARARGTADSARPELDGASSVSAAEEEEEGESPRAGRPTDDQWEAFTFYREVGGGAGTGLGGAVVEADRGDDDGATSTGHRSPIHVRRRWAEVALSSATEASGGAVAADSRSAEASAAAVSVGDAAPAPALDPASSPASPGLPGPRHRHHLATRYEYAVVSMHGERMGGSRARGTAKSFRRHSAAAADGSTTPAHVRPPLRLHHRSLVITATQRPPVPASVSPGTGVGAGDEPLSDSSDEDFRSLSWSADGGRRDGGGLAFGVGVSDAVIGDTSGDGSHRWDASDVATQWDGEATTPAARDEAVGGDDEDANWQTGWTDVRAAAVPVARSEDTTEGVDVVAAASLPDLAPAAPAPAPVPAAPAPAPVPAAPAPAPVPAAPAPAPVPAAPAPASARAPALSSELALALAPSPAPTDVASPVASRAGRHLLSGGWDGAGRLLLSGEVEAGGRGRVERRAAFSPLPWPVSEPALALVPSAVEDTAGNGVVVLRGPQALAPSRPSERAVLLSSAAAAAAPDSSESPPPDHHHLHYHHHHVHHHREIAVIRHGVAVEVSAGVGSPAAGFSAPTPMVGFEAGEEEAVLISDDSSSSSSASISDEDDAGSDRAGGGYSGVVGGAGSASPPVPRQGSASRSLTLASRRGGGGVGSVSRSRAHHHSHHHRAHTHHRVVSLSSALGSGVGGWSNAGLEGSGAEAAAEAPFSPPLASDSVPPAASSGQRATSPRPPPALQPAAVPVFSAPVPARREAGASSASLPTTGDASAASWRSPTSSDAQRGMQPGPVFQQPPPVAPPPRLPASMPSPPLPTAPDPPPSGGGSSSSTGTDPFAVHAASPPPRRGAIEARRRPQEVSLTAAAMSSATAAASPPLASPRVPTWGLTAVRPPRGGTQQQQQVQFPRSSSAVESGVIPSSSFGAPALVPVPAPDPVAVSARPFAQAARAVPAPAVWGAVAPASSPRPPPPLGPAPWSPPPGATSAWGGALEAPPDTSRLAWSPSYGGTTAHIHVHTTEAHMRRVDFLATTSAAAASPAIPPLLSGAGGSAGGGRGRRDDDGREPFRPLMSSSPAVPPPPRGWRRD
jgi:hypothetical protein